MRNRSKVYRQLPVGLFEGSVARKNAVFTGGKSAIDLWSVNDNTINIIELKNPQHFFFGEGAAGCGMEVRIPTMRRGFQADGNMVTGSRLSVRSPTE